MSRKSSASIPGIYTITNTETGTVYVGQAVNVRRRWESHRSYLSKGTHRNRYLQRAWDKYGAEAFAFAIHTAFPDLDLKNASTILNAAEISALSVFEDTYNLMDAGISSPIAGPETRAIWSKQRKAMWSDPGFRQKQSERTKVLYQDADWKARRDQAVREALRQPESRLQASTRFLNLWTSDEHRLAQSAKRKANWQDPEYRAQQSTSRAKTWTNPEVRKRRSEAIKAAWARRKAAT